MQAWFYIIGCINVEDYGPESLPWISVKMDDILLVRARHRCNVWHITRWQHDVHLFKSRQMITWATRSYKKVGAPFLGLDVEQYGIAHDLKPRYDKRRASLSL